MDVMKFGVVSVSEAARLHDLARIVKTAHADGRALVVVCAALNGITDKLIGAARGAATGNEAAVEDARRELWGRHRALAEKLAADTWERETLYREWAELLKIFDRFTRSIATLGEQSPRSIDAVAALGERFATHLVATALRQSGVSARTVDATELIVTDDHFGGAWPFPAESSERIRMRLAPLLQSRIVPVITGYIGATREGIVTTLGRGGGDYSATLIGAALGAEEVCIWTDVDGILTADPKIVPKARTLAELSYVEAAEIATFGAEVLHPRTLAPVAEQGIPLHIRNVLRPDRAGTRVVSHPAPTDHSARAIISARGLSLLGVAAATGGAGWTPDIAGRALARLAEAGVEILTFAQSFSERSLTLAVRGADADFARDTLATIFARERAAGTLREITLTTPVALVAVISAPNGDGLAPRTLTALGRAGAHVLALAQSTASYHISFILPEAEVDSVVRALHADLGLAHPGDG
jgi:aspartate kinase